MSERRHKGFVGRPSSGPKGVKWKVWVKDSASEYDKKGFDVASTHDGISLAQGLNVTFLIGSVDAGEGKKFLKAVDVRLE